MKTKKSQNIFKRFGAWLKERVRKFFVMLKKNPQYIPLAMLCISFLEYSLNLTNLSITTNRLMEPVKYSGFPFSAEDPFKLPMGLFQFIIMLLLILSFVCMLNAFPKRQKPKIPMVLLMLGLYGIVIFSDVCYMQCIVNGLARSSNLTNELANTINSAYFTVVINIFLVAATAILVILEPLIAKLLKKIKTSIEVEGSGDIETIDIADEE